jgi:G3E family GTPase
MTAYPLPVTVISGFAPAGKTALLDHLRASAGTQGRTLAIIREDAGDLRAEVARTARSGGVDAIVIESPRWAEPMSVAESLILEDDEGQTLEELTTIDAMVTVIDAARFLDELGSAEGLAERGLVSQEDDRTIGELSIEQIEFCDVLVIIPADTVDQAALSDLRQILAKINPRAVQLVGQASDIPVEALLGTGHFDFEATASAPGWLTALEAKDANASAIDSNSDAEAHAGSDSQGVASSTSVFVYRARRPFHPGRLFALLHEEWTGVLRSKGLFWIATRNDMAGTLSQVGSTCRHGPAGFWWAAQPTDEWPDDEAFKAEIAHDWFASPDAQGRETVGDRRQELVMIGMAIDRDIWQRKLDTCLLSEAEFALGKEGWAAFDDPFPQWDDDHEHGDHEEAGDQDGGGAREPQS